MKINEKIIPIILGLSAAFIIGVLAFLSFETPYGYWLVFSFGATTFSVLVFYQVDMAQPKNVFFGHLVSITVGLLFNEIYVRKFICLRKKIPWAILDVFGRPWVPSASKNNMPLGRDFERFL